MNNNHSPNSPKSVAQSCGRVRASLSRPGPYVIGPGGRVNSRGIGRVKCGEKNRASETSGRKPLPRFCRSRHAPCERTENRKSIGERRPLQPARRPSASKENGVAAVGGRGRQEGFATVSASSPKAKPTCPSDALSVGHVFVVPYIASTYDNRSFGRATPVLHQAGKRLKNQCYRGMRWKR